MRTERLDLSASGRGLSRTVVATVATAVGSLVLALLLLEEPLVAYRVRKLADSELRAAAVLVEESLSSGKSPQVVVTEVALESGVLVVLRDISGREVAAATTERFSDPIHGEWQAHHNVLVRDSGFFLFDQTSHYQVQLRVPRARFSMVHNAVQELLVLASILAGLVAIFLTFVLGRSVVRPARELRHVADAIARGNLAVRARLDRDDELGAVAGALNRMAEQLSERMEGIRAEQDRLRTVLDSMVEAVFVTDSRGRITVTNEALAELVQGDPRGKTPMEVLRNPGLHEAVRGARKGTARRVELVQDLGGRSLTLQGHVAPLQQGAGVVAVFHDVSTQRETERMRRDFVANASHELRTPLTAIRGFAETLRDGAVQDEESTKRFLDIILRHTMRLQALVQDLSLLSRAESTEQRVSLEDVEAVAMVRDVVRGLATKAEHRGVHLLQDGVSELWVRASERSLDQVLVNLIDNALKYAPENSDVRVLLGVEQGRGLIRVINGGEPIGKEHLARLFERFYRTDNGRSRDAGGTGLGLAIVKHLCLQMKADVQVTSDSENGTVFSVSLPLLPSEPTPRLAEKGAEAQS